MYYKIIIIIIGNLPPTIGLDHVPRASSRLPGNWRPPEQRSSARDWLASSKHGSPRQWSVLSCGQGLDRSLYMRDEDMTC